MGTSLPADPWARRLLVALDDHLVRQRWVAEVVERRLQAKPEDIGSNGAFAHPEAIGQRGTVPGLPDWRYFFHGVGCCLTHRDGTTLDVNFDDHGAESIDPYFYAEYLSSLPAPSGVEALLQRPKPLGEWWMEDWDTLEAAGLLNSCRLTKEGRKLAEELRPWLAAALSATEPGAMVAAAERLADAPLATQLAKNNGWQVPEELTAQAEEWEARRADKLEARIREGHRTALVALVELAPARARLQVESILSGPRLDGLVSTALQALGSEVPDSVLMGVAQRSSGKSAPEPYLRTCALETLLRRYRADTLPASVRDQALAALRDDAHHCEGLAALLVFLLQPEEGLVRLGRALRHDVPATRSEAAAALVLLGTAETAEVLRQHADVDEAKAGLALIRGFVPERVEPEGELVEWRGAMRRVYSAQEILAAHLPGLGGYNVRELGARFGPLLARWWCG